MGKVKFLTGFWLVLAALLIVVAVFFHAYDQEQAGDLVLARRRYRYTNVFLSRDETLTPLKIVVGDGMVCTAQSLNGLYDGREIVAIIKTDDGCARLREWMDVNNATEYKDMKIDSTDFARRHQLAADCLSSARLEIFSGTMQCDNREWQVFGGYEHDQGWVILRLTCRS